MLIGNVASSLGETVTRGDQLTYDLTTGQAVVSSKGRVHTLIVPEDAKPGAPQPGAAKPADRSRFRPSPPRPSPRLRRPRLEQTRFSKAPNKHAPLQREVASPQANPCSTFHPGKLQGPPGLGRT